LYSATEPIMTVTARNGTAHSLTNAITRNYADSYVKITNTSLAPTAYDTQDERYKRFDAGSTPALVTSGLPAVADDPVIAFPTASLTSGVGTLTFKTGTGGLTFTRATSGPSDPFDADISLELNVVDGDGVAYALNPAKFGTATSGGGISFGGNKPMRYGRLRLLNASGPTTVDIPIVLRAEYYINAATGFALNAADSCTPLAAGYFKLSNQTGSLTPINMGDSHVSVPANLTSGIAIGMKLLKASPATSGPGSVRVCFDLDSAPAAGDTSCQRSGGTSMDRPYLQGPWSSAGNYDKDPAAQVNVGTFGAQPNNFIFFRENY
jgi:MSHA biogenesis protein MshQ